jgi:CheY-like chemotaxis protein
MRKIYWRTQNDGTLIAHTDYFDLKVCWDADHELVQFVVQARHTAVPNAIIGSGWATDIEQGMQLATRVANRFFMDDLQVVRPQVVVVDDDTSVRTAIGDALRDDGYKVTEVATAEGALRRLERKSDATLLVTDVDLGTGMTGLELAVSVRNQWPAVGILVISGDHDLSADDTVPGAFLTKPLSTDRLLERIGAISACMQA